LDKEQSTFLNFKITCTFLGICWAVHFLGFVLPLTGYGIHPRSLFGLTGILFSPFLHGSFFHLIANSTGILVFGWALGFVEKEKFLETLLSIAVIGGLGTWIFARSANHIGASGLIFGLFGYLLFLGVFQKQPKFILISIITFFTYGGMIFALIPQAAHISWEGHLFGFLAGIACAKWR